MPKKQKLVFGFDFLLKIDNNIWSGKERTLTNMTGNRMSVAGHQNNFKKKGDRENENQDQIGQESFFCHR